MMTMEDSFEGTWNTTVSELPNESPELVDQDPNLMVRRPFGERLHSAHPLHSPVYVSLAFSVWLLPPIRVTVVPL